MDLQQLKEDLVFQKEVIPREEWEKKDFQLLINDTEVDILKIVKHRYGSFEIASKIVPNKFCLVSKEQVSALILDLLDAINDCVHSNAEYEIWMDLIEVLSEIFQGKVEED